MKDRKLKKKIKVSGVTHQVGTGWLAPMPDMRDYTGRHSEIRMFNKKLGLPGEDKDLPAKVDLRQWCSPVEDQGKLGSCAAQAAAGVVEYFERRAYGKYI
ncbi:MAG: cysteine protease, partial [Bacteroidia bacterium]